MGLFELAFYDELSSIFRRIDALVPASYDDGWIHTIPYARKEICLSKRKIAMRSAKKKRNSFCWTSIVREIGKLLYNLKDSILIMGKP